MGRTNLKKSDEHQKRHSYRNSCCRHLKNRYQLKGYRRRNRPYITNYHINCIKNWIIRSCSSRVFIGLAITMVMSPHTMLYKYGIRTRDFWGRFYFYFIFIYGGGFFIKNNYFACSCWRLALYASLVIYHLISNAP